MEMSGLEYIGALAILAVFFYILVNTGPEHNEADDLPDFGLPATKKKKKKKRSTKSKKKKIKR